MCAKAAIAAAFLLTSACQPTGRQGPAPALVDAQGNPASVAVQSSSPSKPPIGEDTYQSVVLIHSRKESDDGTSSDDLEGTGFLISSRDILTAGHVVFDAQDGYSVSTTATFPPRSGNAYHVELVEKYPPDFAVLELPSHLVGRTLKGLKWGDSGQVNEGDPLFAIGFPQGLDISLAPGVLANKTGVKGFWQTTIPINEGFSGGPIFNSRGEVVGMAIAGNQTMQQVTYAVPGVRATPVRMIVSATDARAFANQADLAASQAETAATRAARLSGIPYESANAMDSRAVAQNAEVAARDASMAAADAARAAEVAADAATTVANNDTAAFGSSPERKVFRSDEQRDVSGVQEKRQSEPESHRPNP